MQESVLYFNHKTQSPEDQLKKKFIRIFIEYNQQKDYLYDKYIKTKERIKIETISPVLDFLLLEDEDLDFCIFSKKPEDVYTLLDNIIFYDKSYVLQKSEEYFKKSNIDLNLINKYLSTRGFELGIKLKRINIIIYIMANTNKLCPFIYVDRDIEPLFYSNNEEDKLIIRLILTNEYTLRCIHKNDEAKCRILLNLLLNYKFYVDIILFIPWKLNNISKDIMNLLYKNNSYIQIPKNERDVNGLLENFSNFLLLNYNLTEDDVKFLIKNLMFTPSFFQYVYAQKENKPYHRIISDHLKKLIDENDPIILNDLENAFDFYQNRQMADEMVILLNAFKYRPKYDLIKNMEEDMFDSNTIKRISQTIEN